jgi:uncharacterized protein HemX
MDPNNNQPIQPTTDTNPLGQTAVDSQPPVTPVEGVVPPMQPTPGIPPMPPVMPVTMNQNPPKKGSKLFLLLLLLLLLVIGMGVYVVFVKNQTSNEKKVATQIQSTVIPTPTIQPEVTPATVDDVNVASPDADLNTLDKDVQGL